ncbi:MAG: RHS repeat-associated core domain-containing protein, partial [Hyphomicrobium sp.]
INYTRDLLGNITATNIKNAGAAIVFSQTQTFDELGRLLRNIGANAQTTIYGYEKNDNLKTVTDPRSGVYSYAYDSLNRLIRETDQENAQVNLTLDVRSGITYAYTYNNANRLKTVTSSANLLGTYTYNGFEQLIGRVITNSGTANGTVFTVHDVFGNVLAELNATGATVREYIWLSEAEIAPTRGSRTTVDRPMAVVSNVNVSPTLLMVHVDHLHRPLKMTNAAGTVVWNAVWQPWGGAHTLTGAEALTARFPGQWFQLEAGLHYNWHRHYDPSLGRYTQPDPLGFVDGPSQYAYARSSPYRYVDKNGQAIPPDEPLPNPPSTSQPSLTRKQRCQVQCEASAEIYCQTSAGTRYAWWLWPLTRKLYENCVERYSYTCYVTECSEDAKCQPVKSPANTVGR